MADGSIHCRLLLDLAGIAPYQRALGDTPFVVESLVACNASLVYVKKYHKIANQEC